MTLVDLIWQDVQAKLAAIKCCVGCREVLNVWNDGGGQLCKTCVEENPNRCKNCILEDEQCFECWKNDEGVLAE